MDKLICVGKNYLKHAVELGDAVPEEPIYFLKPPSVLRELKNGDLVELPGGHEVHHELELVFRIESGRLSALTLGLDLTLRDLQSRLKKLGQPWEKAKVFRNAALLAPFVKGLAVPSDWAERPFCLYVNNQLRQKGFGRDMRWSPQDVLKDLPRWFPVCDGDLLFTGTPEGVGPLVDGDRVRMEGLGVSIEFQVKIRTILGSSIKL